MKTVRLWIWIPAIVLALTTLMIALTVVYQLHVQSNRLKQQSATEVHRTMVRLQRTIEEALVHQHFHIINHEISALGTTPEISSLALIDNRKVIQFATNYAWKKTPATHAIANFNTDIFRRVINQRQPVQHFSATTQLITAYFPIRFPQYKDSIRPSEYGVIYITYDLNEPLNLIGNNLFNESRVLWIYSFIFMFFLILILTRIINQPVNHLVEVINHYSEDTEQQLSKLAGQGEFALLGNAFNQLIHRLTLSRKELLIQKNLYNLLSNINQLISRVKTQQQLFDEVCQFTVKHDDFILAWIGLIDANSQHVEITAKAGIAIDYLHQTSLSFGADVNEHDSSARAIGHNQPGIANNLLISADKPGQIVAGGVYIRSAASFPISHSDQRVGVFNVYSDISGYFSENMVKLLNEIAADISFALESIHNNNMRLKAEAEIEKLAYYDSLTDLPNRRMITDRLTHHIAAAKRQNSFGALLFLDLDNFKHLNDSLGHEAGDELLIQIARRLESQLRAEDSAGRLGGDEFIVLLGNLGQTRDNAVTHARIVTEKILVALRQPYLINSHEYHSNTSIGITLFPEGEDNVGVLFKQADTALYRAKNTGRNSYQFYHYDMQRSANQRLEIEENLRIAITKQQLQIYYQPHFNQRGALTGAEALIRWHHPLLGLVSFNDFITVAEETGLIAIIGQWSLQQVCCQIKRWQEAGLLKEAQRISINVGQKQFKQDNFINEINSFIDSSESIASHLIVEVTENLFLDNRDALIKKMYLLKKQGIHFSIGNFGAGYSCLSKLKYLPLSELKIDPSFITDIHDENDQFLIKTIIAMSHHLKLNVVAKGVNTKEQLDFLSENGCNYYQGDYFSPVLSDEEFTQYLNNYSL
jgi:diguanylate cyclase (GGDEF)-like protein